MKHHVGIPRARPVGTKMYSLASVLRMCVYTLTLDGITIDGPEVQRYLHTGDLVSWAATIASASASVVPGLALALALALD